MLHKNKSYGLLATLHAWFLAISGPRHPMRKLASAGIDRHPMRELEKRSIWHALCPPKESAYWLYAQNQTSYVAHQHKTSIGTCCTLIRVDSPNQCSRRTLAVRPGERFVPEGVAMTPAPLAAGMTLRRRLHGLQLPPSKTWHARTMRCGRRSCT